MFFNSTLLFRLMQNIKSKAIRYCLMLENNSFLSDVHCCYEVEQNFVLLRK